MPLLSGDADDDWWNWGNPDDAVICAGDDCDDLRFLQSCRRRSQHATPGFTAASSVRRTIVGCAMRRGRTIDSRRGVGLRASGKVWRAVQIFLHLNGEPKRTETEEALGSPSSLPQTRLP